MIYLIERLTSAATIIAVFLAFFAALLGIYALASQKKRKARRMAEDRTDYSKLERADTCNYLKFDDIRDNMIITDNGTRFVGVIKCQGFELYAESVQVQSATCQNYYAFINTITTPVTYRQYGQPVDLEDTQILYRERLDAVTGGLLLAQAEMKELSDAFNSRKDTMRREDALLYRKNMDALRCRIQALRFRKFHLEDQIRAIGLFSGGNVAPDRNETYVFDWTYHPMDFQMDLTPEEIHQRAVQELRAMSDAKIHALSNCNVRARRATTEDLIEMVRRYSSPLSAERFKLRDIQKSTFFDDIHTSDAGERLRAAALGQSRTVGKHLYSQAAHRLQNETQEG